MMSMWIVEIFRMSVDKTCDMWIVEIFRMSVDKTCDCSRYNHNVDS